MTRDRVRVAAPVAEFQGKFIDDFVTGTFGPATILVAPTGTGKTAVAVTIVKRLLAQGARRVLIVAPLGAAAEQYVDVVRGMAEAPTVVGLLSRAAARDLYYSGVMSEGRSVVAVVTPALMRHEDVLMVLRGSTWDLTVIELDRLGVVALQPVQELISDRRIGRLLALASLPRDDPENAPFLSSARVVQWTHRELDALVRTRGFRWESMPYTRTDEERRFLAGLEHELGAAREDVKLGVLHRASSSVFALETALRDAVEGDPAFDAMRAERNAYVHAVARDTDPPPLFQRLMPLLVAAPARDSKLEAVCAYVEQRRPDKVVIMTTYSGTAKLVAAALNDRGLRAVALHGGHFIARPNDVGDRDGVLVATDHSVKGLEFADVAVVIHYDVPRAPADLAVRCARFTNGSGVPTVMCIPEDTTDALSLEREWRSAALRLVSAETRP